MMKSGVFLSYCLILTAGIVYLQSELRAHFNRPDKYIAEISHLKEKVKEKEFRNEIDRHEFLEFKQYVATLLPEAVKQKGSGEASYKLRSLASVVQKPKATSLIEMKALIFIF